MVCIYIYIYTSYFLVYTNTNIQTSIVGSRFCMLTAFDFSCQFTYIVFISKLCWDLLCPGGAQPKSQNKEHKKSAFHSSKLKDMINLFRLCFKRWYGGIL